MDGRTEEQFERWQIGEETNRQTERKSVTQTERLTDREADRQKGQMTQREID